jgi:glycosyltransferase involved in cell wall biosynthesis
MKVALIHEWIVNFTGSERVLKVLTELYPRAPIFTSVYDPAMAPQFANSIVNASFIQKIPGAVKKYQWFYPLMPIAMESFDLTDYDLVISNAHSCAKGVLTNPDTCHICYCHSPTRYLWQPSLDQRATTGGLLKKSIISYMRLWDRTAADRPDFFLGNSQNIVGKIEKYYHRPAEVLYPPVETDLFKLADRDPQPYFLIVSRLTKQKRVDLAVKAFLKLNKPLKIIGEGPELARLKKLAGDSQVEFLGHQPDNIVREHYQRCQALILPQEEDFGITPLEAMACGRPVIAYGRGGALETVVPGQTGLFFKKQTVASLAQAVEDFDNSNYNSNRIREQALKFDSRVFRGKAKEIISRLYRKWQAEYSRKR